MLSFNSLGDVYDNEECYKSGWIYIFKRKNHVKVGRTSKTIIERLNQHKVNGEFFDIVCFKTEYDRIYERVILAYIRNIKYKPIDKNEYFDPKNYNEIVSIIESIFKLSFTSITFVYDYYSNKNKDRNKILKKIFDIEWMKERIKGYKVEEYEEDDEESEISNIEYSEAESDNEKQYKMECSNCGKEFSNSVRYENHVNSNICKQTYKCAICSKIFISKLGFNKHYNNCSKETIDLSELLKEKVLYYEKTLKDKELQYEKIIKDKEQQYEKIIKDKELQYEKIIKDKDATIKRLEDRCDNLSLQKNNVQYINNNSNNTNHTNTIVFTDLRKLNQEFINEELANINFLNTNDPFQEICNHVNNSQLGLNYITKDENDNQSSDITKIGKMIHKSIEPKIINVKYSDHKSGNKKYRRKIEELSNSTTDVYNKIMKECIAGAKTSDEIKIIRSSLKDKFEQITEKIKELMDSYDPEGDHHIKYGIDVIFSYVLKGIKDCIRIKNNSLFILVNDSEHDQDKIIEIRDTENHVQNLIYIELLRISMYIMKTCKKLKKSCKDYVEIIDETIDLLKSKDETRIKMRIQNQISSIDLIS